MNNLRLNAGRLAKKRQKVAIIKKYFLSSAIFSSILLAHPTFAQISVLEDFSAGSINTTKFDNAEAAISLDNSNQNIELTTRGFGFTENVRRTRLNLVNETSSVVQADLAINSVSLGNSDSQLAFISVAGFFYNTAAATPSSIEGDIFARVGFGDLGSGLEAFYVISQNTNSDGGFQVTHFGKLDAGSLALDTNYTASITYDGVNNFIFDFNGVNANVAGPPFAGAPFDAQRRVDTGINFGENNSTEDRNDSQGDDASIVSITGRVDNVTNENGLVDDFSALTLNPAIWQSRQFSRSVENGKLKVISKSHDGSRRRTSLRITNQIIDFLGARTTLLSDSTQLQTNSRSRARVGGFWYNDTFDNSVSGNEWEGNVWAHIEIRQSGPNGLTSCNIFAERFNDATGSTRTTLLSQALDGDCLIDTEYDLSIEKTADALLFRKNGVIAHTMPIATPSHPARGERLKVVRADTRFGIGETHALFDDISTDYTAPTLSLNVKNNDNEDLVYPEQVIVNEGELVTLTASVTDPNTISAFVWEQTAGPDVTFAAPRPNLANRVIGDNNQTLSFTVPAGSDTQTLSFKVTIVDNNGVETAQAFNMAVDNTSTSTLATASNPTTTPGGGSSSGGAANPSMVFLLLVFYLLSIRFRNIR